jgi:hypothetical protein
MSEELPRVDVTLPGGQTRPARVQGMRQGPDGRWWVRALLQVPAAAVRPVAGEDYGRVPREPQYVIEPARQRPPSRRALVLHHLGCWAAAGNLLPVESTKQAASLLRFEDTSPCEICEPAPQGVLAALDGGGAVVDTPPATSGETADPDADEVDDDADGGSSGTLPG